MKYGRITKAGFIERKNRFVAICDVAGSEVEVHVPNTGRCREILVPGATVYLQKAEEGALRSTEWTLITAEKHGTLFNLDSHAPNKILREALLDNAPVLSEIGQIAEVKPEVGFGESRLDFCISGTKGQAYVEVKGVTLEREGVALFPDAPTQRGVKHLKTLMNAVDNGYKAAVVFVLQFSGAQKFTPNRKMHEEFAKVLKQAEEHGVKIIAFECDVAPDEIKYKKLVTVEI